MLQLSLSKLKRSLRGGYMARWIKSVLKTVVYDALVKTNLTMTTTIHTPLRAMGATALPQAHFTREGEAIIFADGLDNGLRIRMNPILETMHLTSPKHADLDIRVTSQDVPHQTP